MIRNRSSGELCAPDYRPRQKRQKLPPGPGSHWVARRKWSNTGHDLVFDRAFMAAIIVCCRQFGGQQLQFPRSQIAGVKGYSQLFLETLAQGILEQVKGWWRPQNFGQGDDRGGGFLIRGSQEPPPGCLLGSEQDGTMLQEGAALPGAGRRPQTFSLATVDPRRRLRQSN